MLAHVWGLYKSHEPTLPFPVGWKQSRPTCQFRVAYERARASPALLGEWMGLTHVDITLQARGMRSDVPFPPRKASTPRRRFLKEGEVLGLPKAGVLCSWEVPFAND